MRSAASWCPPIRAGKCTTGPVAAHRVPLRRHPLDQVRVGLGQGSEAEERRGYAGIGEDVEDRRRERPGTVIEGQRVLLDVHRSGCVARGSGRPATGNGPGVALENEKPRSAANLRRPPPPETPCDRGPSRLTSPPGGRSSNERAAGRRKRRAPHRRARPGRGGKYLFLPPGFEGEVPDGSFVYRPPAFTNWAVFRLAAAPESPLC